MIIEGDDRVSIAATEFLIGVKKTVLSTIYTGVFVSLLPVTRDDGEF